MSNFAALIGPLSICGSLKTDGTPNVNGIVWFYSPGTTTPVTVYADAAATVAVTAPVTLDVGGRVPYGTYPAGLYTKQPIRLLIQDSTGLSVSDTVFETGADSTGLSNAGFPNETTVDQGFTALYASLGGIDGQFSPFVGATPLPVYKVISGIQLTPQMFGAKGDGLNDDTNAIQAMINKLVALGGGIGFFPPGTYKISSTLTFPPSSTGITFMGAGQSATVISQSITADVFSSTSGTDIALANLSINGNIGFTGIARLQLRSVIQSHGNSTSAYGLSLSGCSIVSLQDSIFVCATAQSAVAIGGASGSIYLSRCRLGGAGTFNCVDISGASSSIFIDGTLFNGTSGVTGIKFESGYTGSEIYVTNCPTLGGNATPIDTSAISSDPGIWQRNCGMAFTLVDALATGTPVTPTTLYETTGLRVTNNTAAGGSMTVNPPTPAGSANVKGKRFRTYHVNASGGAVTWIFPASAGDYLAAGAQQPPTANNTKFFMDWLWDGANWNLCAWGQAV